MRVNPISAEQADKQANNFDPWPRGEYDFSVYDASEETSDAGNEQIKLTLHVLNRDGQRRTVFDYLVNTEKAQWKIRHFAEAVGVARQYETGELQVADIVSREGRCKLRVKPAQGQYQAQNAVEDYLGSALAHAATSTRQPVRAKAPAGDIDDDIPF